jgi:hypothetical protein
MVTHMRNLAESVLRCQVKDSKGLNDPHKRSGESEKEKKAWTGLAN